MNLDDLATWRILIFILALILGDTALGIAVAMKRDELKVEIAKLPQFLRTGVLPYMGALIILAALAETVPEALGELQAVFYGSAALVVAKYAADIKDKVACIIGKKPPDTNQ